MKLNQKISLIVSCVLFVGVVYGFYNLNFYLILILFALYSLSVVAFAFFSFTNRMSKQEVEEYTQQIDDIQNEHTRKEAELNDSINQKEKLIEQRNEDVERARKEISELSDKIRDLERETDELKETKTDVQVVETTIMNALLPPEDEDGEKRCDIIAVANETVAELREDAIKNGLTISVSSADDKLVVKADRNRLRIMFRNIIDNSIKYMLKTGALVITISTVEDDVFIVLKDSGNGLPEDETEHIFELNYQGSNRISGNGLGLTQAKAIVDNYGGTIYAKSGNDKGMGIYIRMPIK
ncbi:MAG: HAMP domain-containing histidine kinase [Lachnospiraceae bacterium]|nr:HAMP domain-containing histidine kinase [Lachnospiraceae bacterium]